MDYSEAMELIDSLIRQDFLIESEEAVNELNEFEKVLKSSYPELEYPVESVEISEYYGTQTEKETTFHNGIDFIAKVGTPVYAAAEGVVEATTENNDVYGISVKLSHIGGMTTFYGCLNEAVVGAGDKVVAGELIGYSGNSGKATGPHLHFEVGIYGEKVDPFYYLK